MRPIVVSQTGAGTSAVIPVDYMISPFQVSVGVKVTGTVSFSIEHTYDDPFAAGFSAASATWFSLAALTTKTANVEGAYTSPIRALRINQASGSGTTAATIVQAGSGV